MVPWRRVASRTPRREPAPPTARGTTSSRRPGASGDGWARGSSSSASACSRSGSSTARPPGSPRSCSAEALAARAMPPYSIVVVTWQSAGHLAALVGSMNERLADSPELVVVDNASSDDPEGAARRWRGPGLFTRLEANRGFGAAANAGVAQASGDAVVILNPDTELLDGRLGELAGFALTKRALA